MALSERDEARDAHHTDSNPPTEEHRRSDKFDTSDLASRPPLFAGMKQRQYGVGENEIPNAVGNRTSDEIVRDYRRKKEDRKQRAALQIGLKEAYRRTDENGGFIPKTTAPTLPADRSTKSPERMAESRIPISSAYSPQPRTNTGSGRPFSPSRSNTYSRERREARNTPAPAESESDSTGSREGSPSPAPGVRDRIRSGRGESGSGSPIENQGVSHQRRTLSLLDRGHVARAIANSNPLFVKKKPQENTSIFAARRGVGPKVAETTKTLEKKTSASSLESVPDPGAREAGTRVAETARTLAKKTSVSSFEDTPEPPIRPPRSWGERARNTSGAKWMAKIVSPDPSMDMKDLQPSAGGYQARLPDDPLPTIEDISSLQEPTPPSSRPSSAQPNYESLDKGKAWDADADFTAHSLQVSTSPQLRVRSTKLDEIRDREIQSLTARALASNRLEEIRERNSEERLLPSDSARINDEESAPAVRLGGNEDAGGNTDQRTALEEEGYIMPDTPVSVLPRASHRPGRGSELGGAGPPHREDSFETLRALSRVLSVSPAPEGAGKMKDNDKKLLNLNRENLGESGMARSRVRAEKSSDKLRTDAANPTRKSVEIALGNSGADIDVETRRRSRASSPPKSDVDDPEERITAEARLFDLQDNKSERNSIRAVSPSLSSDDEKVEETPRPKVDPQSRPTPRVTGAYIETPLPTVRKPRHARSSSFSGSPTKEVGVSSFATGLDDKRSQSTSRMPGWSDKGPGARASNVLWRQSTSARPRVEPESRPPLINSANPTTAAEDLQRLKEEGNYDDTTFDLRVLVEAETKNTLSALPNLDYDEKGRPLSDKEKDRRIESIVLNRVNQHLRNTSSSIRDARQGIERIENHVSSTNWKITQEKDNKVYMMIPVPRLWARGPSSQTTNQPEGKGRRKLTWLGFFVLLFIGWYIAESVTCSLYCHPSQSSYKTNWDFSDPFFPWAIPTKLDQLTGGVFSRTAHEIFPALGDIFGLPQPTGRHHNMPLGASDWWLGRNGPSPIIDDTASGGASIFSDEIL